MSEPKWLSSHPEADLFRSYTPEQLDDKIKERRQELLTGAFATSAEYTRRSEELGFLLELRRYNQRQEAKKTGVKKK